MKIHEFIDSECSGNMTIASEKLMISRGSLIHHLKQWSAGKAGYDIRPGASGWIMFQIKIITPTGKEWE